MHNFVAASQGKRGFTLIELLVVIAIIGILSAIVLASLNSARLKGSDAAIESDIVAIRNLAELYYGGVGDSTYGTTVSNGSCNPTAGTLFAVTDIARAISAADNANSAGGVKCESNGSSYLVAADLLAVASTYWCMDSNGSSKVYTGTVADLGNTAYACP